MPENLDTRDATDPFAEVSNVGIDRWVFSEAASSEDVGDSPRGGTSKHTSTHSWTTTVSL